ncbi:MAG: hypothetical protein IKN71_02650 [Alphaproteobacteria bacterium]|nr:hypothetical protein [Alphaproteobacteria bacterium]
MMNKLYLCVAATILLAACKSVGYNDLTPSKQPNNNLLPVLEIKTDTSIYPRLLDIGKKKKVVDKRGNDAKNIFHKEVQQNIIETTGANKGSISLRLNYENTVNNSAYSAVGTVSLLALGVPLLFGVPFGAKTQDLEVEVQILNKHKDVIRTYTEKVSDTEYKAAWWGYDSQSIYRKLAAENLKHALENIRYKINNDAPEILTELK